MSPPLAQFEALTAEVEALTRDVESGIRIELGALDSRVGALCEAVIALPRGEAKDYRAPMELLIQALDRLNEALDIQAGRPRPGPTGPAPSQEG